MCGTRASSVSARWKGGLLRYLGARIGNLGLRAEFLVCSILHTGLGYTGGASSARILDAADGVIDGAYYGSRIRSGYSGVPWRVLHGCSGACRRRGFGSVVNCTLQQHVFGSASRMQARYRPGGSQETDGKPTAWERRHVGSEELWLTIVLGRCSVCPLSGLQWTPVTGHSNTRIPSTP